MRTNTILFSSLLLLLPFNVHVQADYADVILADEPVAYWHLDEVDPDGSLIETTGNVPPGTFEDLGGLGLGFPGAIVGEDGTAVLFSEAFGFGCGGLCSRGIVPVSDGSILNLGTTTAGLDMSMEAWFQLVPNSAEVLPNAAFPRIFHYNNSAFGQYSFGVVGDNNAGFEAARTVWAARGTGDPDSSVHIKAAETDAIAPSEDQEWYHFVATIEGANIRLFLNAEEQFNLTDADPIFWQARQATIGARLQSNETSVVQSFPGLLDEIAIYDKLLTHDQIAQHYLAGIGQLSPGCDFDGNGSCDTGDIDALMNVVADGSNDSAFDLNADGLVNDLDRDAWLTDAGPQNGFAGPLLVGDADLDGTVGSGDLNALALTWQTDNNNWSNGNFTGGGTNAGDLNELALNWQSSVALAGAQAVPEPSGIALALCFAVGLLARQRKKLPSRI
jgi:hypothetical protein